MNKCKSKKWFTLDESHGRDHGNLILTSSDHIWYFRRQDGRVELMMEFESATVYSPTRFPYMSAIGNVSWEDFCVEFEVL